MDGLHTIYVLTDKPSVFGLPEEPRLATTLVGAQWLSGVITAGVIAILPFWLLFNRRNKINEENNNKVGGTS